MAPSLQGIQNQFRLNSESFFLKMEIFRAQGRNYCTVCRKTLLRMAGSARQVCTKLVMDLPTAGLLSL